jgi:hypothetical protein
VGRHIAQGNLKAWFSSAALADPAAPALATELAAATNLLGTKGGEALADVRGFKPQASVIPTDDYIDAISGNIGGVSQYPQSSLLFYSDLADQTMHDALAEGASGEIILADLGGLVADPSRVFTTQILFNEYDPAKSAAVMFEVAVSIAAPTKGAIAT